MKQLKLEAKNPPQELVKKYLEENVSDVLAEKINNGTKTLQGCWNFIVGEAKKKAVQGCACIEDREVFGWAVHYFEEDSIKECKSAPTVKTATTTPPKTPSPQAEKKPSPKTEPKAEAEAHAPTPKAPQKPSKAPTNNNQMSIFDLF